MSTTTTNPDVVKPAIVAALCLLPATVFAQASTVVATTPTDFTPIVVALVGGAFSVIGIVATALINRNLKDTQAATTLNTALANSLGVVQNAIDQGLANHPLQVALPGMSAPMAAGVQYALDHAGEEATRLGVTPQAIAEKIDARMGVAKMGVPATPPAVSAAH